MTYEEIAEKYNVKVRRVYLRERVGYCGLKIEATILRTEGVNFVSMDRIASGKGYINIRNSDLGCFALIELEGKLLIASETLSEYPLDSSLGYLNRFEEYLVKFSNWRNYLEKVFLPINSIHFIKGDFND